MTSFLRKVRTRMPFKLFSFREFGVLWTKSGGAGSSSNIVQTVLKSLSYPVSHQADLNIQVNQVHFQHVQPLESLEMYSRTRCTVFCSYYLSSQFSGFVQFQLKKKNHQQEKPRLLTTQQTKVDNYSEILL